MSTYKDVRQEDIYIGKWVKIVRFYYLDNGVERFRDILVETGGDGVYVVAITDQNEVIFIRQNRAFFGPQIEFPAGRLGDGETPQVAALKELSEESGYDAETLVPLGQGPVLSGTTTQATHFFLALNLHFVGQHKEADEDFIGVFTIPLEEAENFIIDLLNKGLGDPKMLVALRLAINYLQKSPTEYAKFWLKIWENRAKNWLEEKTKKEEKQNV